VDPVRLVIKVFPNPHNTAAQQIAELQAADRDAPAITLIDRDSADSEILDLYRDADAVVLPTRGEGFNIPAAEAMATGLPLIATGYSGHLDFCNESVRLIDYSFAASGSHLAESGSLWVEPDVGDLTRAMLDAFSQRAWKPKPPRLPDARAFADGIITAAAELMLRAPVPPLRIGWVSSWGVRCGIAEYSRHLLDAILANCERGEITVLCDNRTDADAPGTLDVVVRPCWSLGLLGGALSLARTVAEVDPDVLVIQHQPGLIAWESLAELLGTGSVRGRPVVLVLHTTARILDITEEDRGAVILALASVARIVVHTIHDVNRLKVLGLVANVAMIPQGAIVSNKQSATPLAAKKKNQPVRIGCYGFFLKDKGILQLIQAVARLRDEFSEIRLCLVNAQYDAEESVGEIAWCRAAAEAAGLGGSVEWHTDFLPDEDSRRLLRNCDIIALPYQASKEGSSAALRMAMSAGVPVAVTPLPLFDEAGAAVFRLRGTDSADIAVGIAFLLDRPEQRQALAEEMRRWLAGREWPLIASRFQGMLKGLRANWEPRHAEPAAAREGGSSPVLVSADAVVYQQSAE
jgi:glycosyltransferase involved in cell wall biosynthesis